MTLRNFLNSDLVTQRNPNHKENPSQVKTSSWSKNKAFTQMSTEDLWYFPHLINLFCGKKRTMDGWVQKGVARERSLKREQAELYNEQKKNTPASISSKHEQLKYDKKVMLRQPLWENII